MQSPMTPAPEYEFSNVQNGVIGELASKMRFAGLMGMVFGVLLVATSLAPVVLAKTLSGINWANVVAGGASLVIGTWTRGAAGHFQNIVDTEGNDIGNLMTALDELRRAYAIQRVVFGVAALALVMAVLLYLTFLASH